jgi:phage/plasmid-associated DNA primase
LAKSPNHLLEKLRAKAELVSAKRVQQQQLVREAVERVDGRSDAVFQYCDEACKLPQIIAPAIELDSSCPRSCAIPA